MKNSRHLKRNVFVLFSPRVVKIEPATYNFRGDQTNELFHGRHRLWVEILNKSFEHPIEISRSQPLVFLVIEPENLKFQHHVLAKKKITTKRKNKKTYTMKAKKADRRLYEQIRLRVRW